jgi:ABC-type branched-subunit amino acid transport system substrate-binding protein
MSVRIFGSDRMASRAFLEAAGEAAEGVVAAATHDPTRDDPRLRAFVEAFTQRFDRAPETFAAHAYDGANILLAAVEKAGPNRVRIRDALYENSHYDGVTGPIIFDTTLNDIGPVYLASVTNGRFEYRRVDFASAPPQPRGAKGRQEKAGTEARAGPPGVGGHGRPLHTRAAPYRALRQSPPAARSPDRPPRRTSAGLRIGCFLPLDEPGEAAVRGMRSAIADDRARHPERAPVELVVRDARGPWGENADELVDLVLAGEVLAVIGSTERRGTHLAEMLAAKMHFPVVTLCGDDPTVTLIPLAWVFCVGAGIEAQPSAPEAATLPGIEAHAALGYDAAALVLARIRAGAHTRRALREGLATGDWHQGVTGTFRFDSLGRRLESPPVGEPVRPPPARVSN